MKMGGKSYNGALGLIEYKIQPSYFYYSTKCLCTLYIEKTLLNDLSRVDSFKEWVIDVFTEQKTQ